MSSEMQEKAAGSQSPALSSGIHSHPRGKFPAGKSRCGPVPQQKGQAGFYFRYSPSLTR